jgi:hypothetical protein
LKIATLNEEIAGRGEWEKKNGGRGELGNGRKENAAPEEK